MQNLRIKIIVISIVIVAILSAFGISQYKQRVRLLDNQNALLSEITYIRIRNDKIMSEVEILRHTNKEIKEFYPQIVKDLKDMKIKLNKVNSVSNINTENITKINTIVKDSIVITKQHDTITLKKIDYKDAWITFKGVLLNDSMNVQINVVDSLTQVVWDDRSWFRKNVMFWTRQRLRQSVKTQNPNTHIRYSEFIQITNKKGE